MVDQYNEHSNNKPMLFGKKVWEEQQKQIGKEHAALKAQYQSMEKDGLKRLLGQDNFKAHAWKEYKKQHPDKAEQYQKLAKPYQVIKKCVEEIKQEQRKQLKPQKDKEQAPTKTISRDMSR